MNKFYLNCWVPSLKNYFKVEELKMYQLEILSKYILNDDDVNINIFFNDIITQNVVDKNILVKLTKFDKWFLLLFLRASSISSMLFYQAKDKLNNNCAISFNLFDILTDLSEIKIHDIQPLHIDDITINFTVSKNLYSNEYVLDNVFKVSLNKKDYYPQTFSLNKKERFFNTLSKTFFNDIESHLAEYKNNFDSVYILKNDKELKDFYSIKFNLLDNSLYYFLKSTFLPYSQDFHKKKFLLLSKLGIDLKSLQDLTPLECDIFINLFNGEKEKILG